MSELHKLIKLIKTADDLERMAMDVFGSHKHSEVKQIIDLKSSLWGRISGEIDNERERAERAERAEKLQAAIEKETT